MVGNTMIPKVKIQLSKVLKSPADAPDPEAGGLEGRVRGTIAEVESEGAGRAVLSGRPVGQRVGVVVIGWIFSCFITQTLQCINCRQVPITVAGVG